MENRKELEDDLAHFREKWKRELDLDNKSSNNTGKKQNNEENTQTVEERAAQLFSEGTRYEKSGQFNVAVHYYRQAVHLVPDIEFRIAELQKATDFGSSSDDDSDVECNIQMQRDHQSVVSLTEVFGSLNVRRICEPAFSQEATHISDLPSELLVLLFKWVVSKDIDVRSLARLSFVCRGFYACAHDEEIWKHICLSIWGIRADANLNLYDSCWRKMFIERPHLKFDGIYISTNSYVHIGEPSIGQCYKPCHLVTYYKYLRFFPDGTVFVHTSSDDPQSVVQLLRHRYCSDPNVYRGFYRLSDEDKINVYFIRETKPQKEYGRRNRVKPDVMDHHFYMNLTLQDTSKQRNHKLTWDNYTLQIKSRKTGIYSESDVNHTQFKPFIFSCVRSYFSRSVCTL